MSHQFYLKQKCGLYRIVFLCIALNIYSYNVLAQSQTTLTFTGKSSLKQEHIPMHHIEINNLTQHWEELLYYPDTLLQFGSVGIDDYDRNGTVQLLQNVPNPFDGITDFTLQLEHSLQVTLEVYDLTGRKVAAYSGHFSAGHHLFRATLSSPQTYLLSATSEAGRMAIKMINKGEGEGNSIIYLGAMGTERNLLELNSSKGITPLPFILGDEMVYVGHVYADGNDYASQTVQQRQWGTETIPLFFGISTADVQTYPITGVSYHSATCGGEVTNDGGMEVTARGVCWSTSPNPTINSSFTSDSTGTGSFTSILTGMSQNTTYYVRAYATNGLGTVYGDEMNFTTLRISKPTVTTSTVTAISSHTATCGGNVISDGGANVTARGVCWSEDPDPMVSDSHTENDAGLGSFISSLTNLTDGTTYYVRAYAINSVDTAYGNTESFTTVSCNNVLVTITGDSILCSGQSTTLTASGANSYVWSTGSTGGSITLTPASSTTYVVTGTDQYGCSASNSITVTVAPVHNVVISGNNNVCEFDPVSLNAWVDGTLSTPASITYIWYRNGVVSLGANDYRYYHEEWYLPPSDYQFRVEIVDEYGCSSWSEPFEVHVLAAPSVQISASNTTVYSGRSVTLTASGANSYVWSNGDSGATITVTPQSTTTYTVTGTDQNGCYNTADVTVTVNNTVPNVTVILEARDIWGDGSGYQLLLDADATAYGDIIPTDGPLTSSGNASAATYDAFEYKIPQDADGILTTVNVVYNGRAQITIPAGIYDFCITNPTPEDRVWIANNGRQDDFEFLDGYTYHFLIANTGSGDTMMLFVTPPAQTPFACGTSTVTDIDGNPYHTVKIGEQCWMRENLRAKKYADGTPIAQGSSWSFTTGYWYYPNNTYYNMPIYGLLYNWPAVMRNSVSSNANPSGVQGICPTGWHVPSDAEWTQMTDYASSRLQYICDNNSTYIAKALAGTTGWSSSDEPCAVGNTQSNNNATGFNALPAGNFNGNNFTNFTFATSYWGTTQVSDSAAYCHYLANSNANVGHAGATKVIGFSVRCVRDEGSSSQTVPTVTTSSVSNISSSTATCGGNVTSNGGANVTARGVCWSTSHTPTTSNSHTTDGNGAGSFTSSITGLTPNTTYYVRAYATNSVGTAYGNEVSFTTPCNNVSVSVSGTTSIITGQSTTLTASGASSYRWSTGATTATITVSPTTTTTYTVTGTNQYGCTGSASVTVTVSEVAPPTVTTNTVSSIGTTSATCGGNVTNDGGASVTVRGVCWGTSHNPTISNSHTTNGNGTGSFTSSITGLTSNTTYYVRAYATNSVGTAYGSEVSFTTTSAPSFTCGTSTLTDIDGNTYNTVQIGGQCWMKENLRTTKYPDGTGITKANSSPYYISEACWFYPSDDSTTKQTYGLLYNWEALMYGHTSSNATPSGVQGICPDGWHIPSSSEWTILTDYVSNQSQFVCGNTPSAIASALADTMGWETNNYYYCTPSYNPSGNNATGFSALPSDYSSLGSRTSFGSSTGASTYYGYTLYINGTRKDVQYSMEWKQEAYAVRCVLNEEHSSFFPAVTTSDISNITSHSVTCGGTITSNGNVEVTSRGICWSTNHNPSIIENHSANSSGPGTFSNIITDLTSNITYYVRAYATNQYGTVYGNEVSFIIPINHNGDDFSCPNEPTVTDIDGNVYNTVLIGGQCWMRENLRTTRYADGTDIPQGEYSPQYGYYSGYWYYPYDDSSYLQSYGLLYNWKAVMRDALSSDATPSGVQGACPDGWHVPSNSEWLQLIDYVSSHSEYACGNNNNNIAKSLASKVGWQNSNTTCSVGNTPSNNNATRFGALPTGYLDGGHIHLRYSDYNTSFWSATAYTERRTYYFYLGYNSVATSTNTGRIKEGYSVRCLQNEGSTQYFPTVTTNIVTSVTANTASCGGNVTSINGAEVTSRGVCWSIHSNPTIADRHTTDGSGTGSFNSSLTDLASNFTYYVRAYATNQYGTVYGNEVSFTTPINSNGDSLSCPGTPTLTDRDGNVYNTVQIGNQCWMRENLRTTKYADGTDINYGYSQTYNRGYWYYPAGRSDCKQSYGLLYNWKAVMRNENSSEATPSGVQGICPTGWHVPSNPEWTQLTNYVSSQNEYGCGNNNSIAKALASTMGWENSSYTCSVGNIPTDNNASGFGAVPAGDSYANDEGAYNLGSYAYFWSATETSSTNARYLFIQNAQVGNSSYAKFSMQSVRCLRDEGNSTTNGRF